MTLLSALRPVSARLSHSGSMGAVGMFASTLSLLFTTPGDLAGFLIKDLMLFGAALCIAIEARRTWEFMRG